jgi:hypothetical protein
VLFLERGTVSEKRVELCCGLTVLRRGSSDGEQIWTQWIAVAIQCKVQTLT